MKIFISYRRKDTDFTHRLAEKLQDCIIGDVFVDRKIAEDDFVEALLRQLRECWVFALVVTEHTFAPERIHQADDWVRREIAEALALNKPIVLILREGCAPPDPSQLPENIRAITRKQGIFIYATYFDEGVQRLAQHCETISSGAVRYKAPAASQHLAPLPPTPRREDVLPPTPRRDDDDQRR